MNLTIISFKEDTLRREKNSLGESLEDYIEAILLFEESDGDARVTKISKKLNVSKPSVTEALQILKDKKIVNYNPYKPITLTNKGKNLAIKVKDRHEKLYTFLRDVLKVDKEKAEMQACRMEHILEKDVINKFCNLGQKLLKGRTNLKIEKV